MSKEKAKQIVPPFFRLRNQLSIICVHPTWFSIHTPHIIPIGLPTDSVFNGNLIPAQFIFLNGSQWSAFPLMCTSLVSFPFTALVVIVRYSVYMCSVYCKVILIFYPSVSGFSLPLHTYIMKDIKKIEKMIRERIIYKNQK